MKNTPPKPPPQTGYWTIDVLPDGGYTVARGFGATRASFACSTMHDVMAYILKRARGE